MLEDDVVGIVASWLSEERQRGGKRTVGIANGALVLIEYFREQFPLRPEHYTSRGGSQVKGLSGRKGAEIIGRFWPDAPPFRYTEGGRTSRGTLPAVRGLAERLNAVKRIVRLNEHERGGLADAMQRWLVENPLREHFEQQRLEAPLDPKRSSLANVAAILAAARERGNVGPVAQHLVGAKLALRYQDQEVDNYSYSTADAQLNRPGDFVVGDTVFHVTMTPAPGVLEKCRDNLGHGYRAILLVPEDRRQAAAQMAENIGLADRIAVLSIEAFIGQNVEEIAAFSQVSFETDFRRLLETYNERVRNVEPDPSVQIEIPSNLGRGS